MAPAAKKRRRTISPEFTHHRARVASLTRSRPDDDPELVGARQCLKAASLADYIRSVVDGWPPLSIEQRERLSLLLRDGSGAP